MRRRYLWAGLVTVIAITVASSEKGFFGCADYGVGDW